MPNSYDKIGVNYSDIRKPDPRIASVILEALGSAKTILNVGAGTGSDEPNDLQVTALEPSTEMIRQRPPSGTPVVQGFAKNLPFLDNAFDASMASLTVHHWRDQAKGLKEMRRVTRGPVVILTFDPSYRAFWLNDYIPGLVTLDETRMPELTDYETSLGPVTITPVPIPHDCSDGFLAAYWRRPAAYLDPAVRNGISCFWALGDISGELTKLANDVDSGAWAERHADLLEMDKADFGYRLVTAKS
ncbi:MAG: class I SAM-dependent methyltransferase [Alphaproteobacteria bacterium]